ncbi:GNAT family N-acetyltransferase [Emticicia sp. BO119]|uniref:GNAT family N-acetyltransferase n=1 Tax=Emticicia sp. BO119 TaxID=2757768 RepID=UPI0015F07C91|nr:GNAT family N-acetyltransferase [Emticicia sp. BO119]MBA4849914.1 GNAT family N-acetyltransferase [Emticicia sp. BO119]
MNITIQKIATVDDLDEIKALFREYEKFLGVSLCFQNFEEELAKLPAKYAEPEGAIFLAKANGKSAGCVALWKLEDGICEMKRLYVKPEFQGLGFGKKLVYIIIEEAQKKGYKKMKLDTLRRLESANHLYKSLKFTETTSYNYNPEEDVAYFEKDLV